MSLWSPKVNTSKPILITPAVDPTVVQPVWNVFSQPPHYNRSAKAYTYASVGDFRERGFKGLQIEAIARILPAGAIIAGGAVANSILGEEANTDIDIFFTTSEAFENTYNLLTAPPKGNEDSWAVSEYSANISLDDVRKNWSEIRYVKFESSKPGVKPIQLIKMAWFDDAAHVIDSFDFTVCQFALEGDRIWYCPMAVMDLLKKRLNLNKMQFPAVSLRRLIKYTGKGFYAAPSLLLKIAESIKTSEHVDPHAMIGKDY